MYQAFERQLNRVHAPCSEEKLHLAHMLGIISQRIQSELPLGWDADMTGSDLADRIITK